MPEKFDYEGATPQNLKVTEAEFDQAWKQITPELKTAIDQAFSNIKEVHQRQMPEEVNLAQRSSREFLRVRRFPRFPAWDYTFLEAKEHSHP